MHEEKDNRRKYPRAPVNVEIICDELKEDNRRGNAVLCFYSSNISLGGIFLETDVPFEIGSTLHLKFNLPGLSREIKVVGKVIRTNDAHTSKLSGMGIEFEHLSYEDRKMIEGYVIDSIADQL